MERSRKNVNIWMPYGLWKSMTALAVADRRSLTSWIVLQLERVTDAEEAANA